MFWQTKFAGTLERDAAAIKKLQLLGWRVAVVWECALEKQPAATSDRVSRWLQGQRKHIEVG